jgi:hypothetical protein
MRPAFSSAKQAAAFTLLLLVLLCLPLVILPSWLPSREQAYNVWGWSYGPSPWIHHEIFEETNDIDIALMGSSRMIHAIDPRYLQQKLSEKLGRPAVVRMFGWGGPGFDSSFFVAGDLLAHRRVRMLVSDDENPLGTRRNPMLMDWFRYRENAGALGGLTLSEKAAFYFAAIRGMPHIFLELLRPNLDAPLVTDPPNGWELGNASESVAGLLGATRSKLGFRTDLDEPYSKFIPYVPPTEANPAAEVYSPEHTGSFEFQNAPLPNWQMQFARRFAVVTLEQHCALVLLYLPSVDEARLPTIAESQDWPRIMPGAILLGIPPAEMFNHLADDDVRKLYLDRKHFNENGMDYFTPLITPALLKTYETISHP